MTSYSFVVHQLCLEISNSVNHALTDSSLFRPPPNRKNGVSGTADALIVEVIRLLGPLWILVKASTHYGVFAVMKFDKATLV